MNEFKSGVKPSIRRTGAEIIDFLVFLENIPVNYGGEKRNLRWTNFTVLYEVKSLYIMIK